MFFKKTSQSPSDSPVRLENSLCEKVSLRVQSIARHFVDTKRDEVWLKFYFVHWVRPSQTNLVLPRQLVSRLTVGDIPNRRVRTARRSIASELQINRI